MSIVIGIIGSIVGALLVICFQWFYRRMNENSSPFTGKWHGGYYDDDDTPLARDEVIVRQNGENVMGTIARLYPEEQNHRKWIWTGKLKDKNLFAIFWPTTADIPSYGCLYLRQVNDDCFTGHYLSYRETMNPDGTSFGQLKTLKAKIERTR